MNQGFILLHRQFLEWEWYQDNNTKALFIHCLLKANFEEKEWRGIIIKRGQFFTSVNHLSIELNMSIKEIRTSLKKLKKTKEIEQKGASNGTMLTICKYDDYQQKKKVRGKQRASEGQAKGKRGATTNNDNNDNNKKKSVKEEHTHKDFYKSEYEKAENNELKSQYLRMINLLYGKNNENKIMHSVLKIENQLTFDNFQKIHKNYRNDNNTITDILMSMENKPKAINGNKSLYQTMINWMSYNK